MTLVLLLVYCNSFNVLLVECSSFRKAFAKLRRIFQTAKTFSTFFRCRPEASFRRALRGLFLKSECKGRHFRRNHQTNQRKISVKISFTAELYHLAPYQFLKQPFKSGKTDEPLHAKALICQTSQLAELSCLAQRRRSMRSEEHTSELQSRI